MPAAEIPDKLRFSAKRDSVRVRTRKRLCSHWTGTNLPADEEKSATEKRVRRALESAQKYSLVANSVKSEVRVEPLIEIVK
jgi:hypothetical protein